MYRIKCSNGKYVSKTREGNFVECTKNGKVWNSKNLVNKNLKYCEKFANSEFVIEKYGKLTFIIEEC